MDEFGEFLPGKFLISNNFPEIIICNTIVENKGFIFHDWWSLNAQIHEIKNFHKNVKLQQEYGESLQIAFDNVFYGIFGPHFGNGCHLPRIFKETSTFARSFR